jgi:hypothetical protein
MLDEVGPLDFLKSGTEYSNKEKRNLRLNVCRKCPELHFKVCSQCGCFMPAKVMLENATCPLGKW